MARWQPWAIIDGAYSDETRPWSSQDTVNWLPTPAEQSGTRSPSMLRTPPGLELYVDLGTNAPLRGSHDVEGLLLVVSGSTLFSVVDGVATSRGTIPGVGRVSMDHVPRGTGFQVGIANGSSGYVYNTADNTLVQITDEGFPGAVIFQFVDNYLAFLEPFGRFWGHSELNDALSYNTLDRYTAESAPDPIRSLIQSHREIFTPGTRSGEFFRNTGSATGTFQRSDGTEMERGCATPFAIARWDNTVAWLGEDNSVYRLEGHQPVRISTGPIEQAIARAGTENAFMFVWEDRGHEVVYLTLPNGQTWGFDAWTQRWHRRESYGLNRWRLSTLTKTRGQWIGGDYLNGKLYRVVWQEGAVHENGAPMESRRRFPVAHDDGNPLIINGVKLMFDTGQGGPDPLVISGDLPNGMVGQAVDPGGYAISGGIPPYGPVTVVSGALPTGIALATDGEWSSTYTADGAFSWEVAATDSFGETAAHPDTATVAPFVPLALISGAAPAAPNPQGQYTSVNTAWTSIPQTGSGLPGSGKPGYGNGVWMVVGNGAFYRSETLTTWTSSTKPAMTGTNAIGYGNGVWIVGGDGTMARSTDEGLTFSAVASWSTVTIAPNFVEYADGRWIAGLSGNNATTGPIRYSDDDGVTWTRSTAAGFVHMSGAAKKVGGLWYLAGGPTDGSSTNVAVIKTSPDGLTGFATLQSAIPSNIRSWATDGAGRWVAACFAGQVIYTADNWATFNTSSLVLASGAANYRRVSYFNGEFLVSDDNAASPATIRRSLDGGATFLAGVATVLNNSVDIVNNNWATP